MRYDRIALVLVFTSALLILGIVAALPFIFQD